MRFYTSYYANIKNIPTNYLLVGISRFCPEWLHDGEPSNFMFIRGNFLAPSAELLEMKKNNDVTESQFADLYKKQISDFFDGNVPFKDWINTLEMQFSENYDAIVFLCYEQPTSFCHRHLLRDIFNDNQFHIEEHPYPVEKREKINSTPLF